MSNERFDRLMKKNLESVRPAYKAQAWSRFQKRLPISGFWPWLKNYGGWLMSGFTLIGWLTSLYTLHTNQQLLDQLSRQTPVHQVIVPPKFPNKPEMPPRVDTVYIIKRTIVEQQYVQQVADDDRFQPIQPKAFASSSPPIPTDPVIIHSSPRVDAEGEQKPKSRKDSESTRDFTAPGIIRSTQTKLNPESAPHQQTESSQYPDSTSRSTAAETAVGQLTTTVQTQLSTDSVLAQAQKPIDQLVESKTVAATQPKQPTASKPSFRLSSIKPRIGIESIGSVLGAGVGPVLEIFPAENLGISIGVQASSFHTEHHHELRDFNSSTGQEFIDQFKAYIPAQYDQIKDISMRASVISMPLMLNYYVQLRRNWSLICQTGTRFDLAAYQQVRYESYLRGEEKYHKFEIDAKPTFFHNFMFATGLQYRRGRVSAQLTPFYLYDFRSIIYTQTGSSFGGKASIWLNLFK